MIRIFPNSNSPWSYSRFMELADNWNLNTKAKSLNMRGTSMGKTHNTIKTHIKPHLPAIWGENEGTGSSVDWACSSPSRDRKRWQTYCKSWPLRSFGSDHQQIHLGTWEGNKKVTERREGKRRKKRVSLHQSPSYTHVHRWCQAVKEQECLTNITLSCLLKHTYLK